MTRLGSRLSRGVGRMALGVFATAAAALLWAPGAIASPETDAGDAINQAWETAGGDGSPVGTKDGDVYAVGDGFAQNFSGGKIFFTPATGAHLLFGAVLDKYQALGGAADSDLGFPTIDAVAGLVGPDSQVSTFSASDKPAIFWTPATGAWVVRGAINAAWDKLGGSAGTMGVPTQDETFNGTVISQKFTGGEISYDTAAKTFTTVPPELAGNLAGVEVPSDATTAINQAWRAAGGLAGPLGARQGAQQAIGTDGAAQDYAGGKVFYSPATGAHAVTGAILAKYEAQGGPTGDLGLPTGTEADGGAPNSRVSAFSAADNPVIFWTPDNGAIVVRGAINAAWAKLGGATGKLGVPTGEQSVNGDTTTQKFSGGEISWNKASNTFTTKPPELAGSLSGVQVPAAGPQAGQAGAKSGSGSAFHWWWLLIIVPVLLLLAVIGLGVLWLQRRRSGGEEIDDDFEEYDDEDHWPSEVAGEAYAAAASRFSTYPDGGVPVVAAAPGFGWAPEGDEKSQPAPEDVFDGDQDSIDTTPTRIPAEAAETDGYEAEDADEVPAEPAPEEILESDVVDIEEEDSTQPAEVLQSDVHAEAAANRPAIHLPLSDPYQAPEGYVVKANTHSGLYYTPDSELYDHTVPEVWFASEELAQANGFHKAE
ncbi:MAG: LGFP repeat-containing protein [Mycolicibacterium aromaticivorans]|nr:LGFP repeat-containing protein [Mycolicibacterium aromaticivorans]